MLFSSTTFIFLFLPAVLIIYYGLLRKSRKLQNFFLAIASLLFYAWGEPVFVLVMLLSIGANWFFGLSVSYYKNKNKQSFAKIILTSSVCFNLLILYIFKYLTFSATVVTELLSIDAAVPQIALPIGISFFTFQAMSYVIDVYCDNGESYQNIMNVALYISFFPQLIAGPIVRYETVAHEIIHRKEHRDDFLDGFSRFVVGFSKKVLLSNNLSVIADQAFSNIDELSVAASWLGAICYAFQIFFDFSGYSDMAIGLGKMFGFHFLENFDYPYISRSITEFWRRWHISLGTWFRDYVYFPLGGSRVKTSRLVLNLFVVWSLTGIWHGANWTFIVWGLMYFVLLTIEKLSGLNKGYSSKISSTLKWIYTMFFVLIGWVVFRANSLMDAFTYLKTMLGFSGNSFSDISVIENLKDFWFYLLPAIIFSTPFVKWVGTKVNTKRVTIQIGYQILLTLLFIGSLIYIVSNSNNPFIYFNF